MKHILDNKAGFVIMNKVHTEVFSGRWPHADMRPIDNLGTANVRVFRNAFAAQRFVEDHFDYPCDIVAVVQEVRILYPVSKVDENAKN